MGSYALPEFGTVDYVLFSLLLSASLGIGVYHGIRGNKTTDDFLLASRSMSPIPVALSLTATWISSISILGYPGEVYAHGIQLVWSLIGMVLGTLLAVFLFLPVIYALKLGSVNEYVELRFRSPFLRKCVLAQSSVSTIIYLGICLYAPTLAMESVTPISSSTYIMILGTVVTLYSAFGGLKAVVWTDAFQTFIIIIGIVIATISAVVNAGGPVDMWNTAKAHGRTEALRTGFGLFERHTIFNTILMNTLNFTFMYSFRQSTIQRVGTLSDYRTVKRVLCMNAISIISMIALLFVAGIGIFAVYANCDPLTLGYIYRKDQILPYYVMEYLGFLSGVPGMFVACLFSGTMSSISSALNSLPAMLWLDYISHFAFFKNSTERVKTIANKLMTFFLGIVMIGLAFLSSNLGGLIQATSTLRSIVTGPTLGVFLLGVCFPFCTKKGAISGLFASMIFMSWLAIGSQLYGMNVPMLPLSISGCSNDTHILDALDSTQSWTEVEHYTTISTTTIPPTDAEQQYSFYNVSYTLLSPIGTFTCMLVGILVSFATGLEKMEDINPAHVLPCFRRYVGKKPQLEEAELHHFIDASTPTIIKAAIPMN